MNHLHIRVIVVHKTVQFVELLYFRIFNLFATSEPPKYSNSNSPNLCFCLLKGDKKTFLLVENIFWTNENIFLSPFNKLKQRFRELEFKYFGGSDVVNKLFMILNKIFEKKRTSKVSAYLRIFLHFRCHCLKLFQNTRKEVGLYL